MADRFENRREQFLGNLPKDVSSVCLVPSETLYYFTGLKMSMSERPMLLVLHPDNSPAAILPKLERDRVRGILGEKVDFFVYSDATNSATAAKAAFEQYADVYSIDGTVATEFRSTRLVEHEVFSPKTGDVQIVDVGDGISELRERKDQNEVDLLHRATENIDSILSEVTAQIELGMTEREVERILHKKVLDSEADRLGMSIVASGPNSAKPHTNTGTRKIEDGDPLIIDAGVVCEGYYSDITRTYMVGSDSPEIREMHECAREAARAARNAVEPGRPFQDVDRIARDIVEEAGYGEFFPHRVGHGIGLEEHEPPYLVEGNEASLQTGHTITVEPGIYIEGTGGVRIEDDLVVTEDGAEVLTSAPRELRII